MCIAPMTELIRVAARVGRRVCDIASSSNRLLPSNVVVADVFAVFLFLLSVTQFRLYRCLLRRALTHTRCGVCVCQ